MLSRYAEDGKWNTLSMKFRSHCLKEKNCQKLARERANERASSSAGSGVAGQIQDARPSSADQQSNDIAHSPNTQNGEHTSQHPVQDGQQQRLHSPNRQENNPQTAQSPLAVDPHDRTDSNGSGRTLQGSRSLGGSSPWGEVKGSLQPSEENEESRRGSKGFMKSLKSTLGRKASKGPVFGTVTYGPNNVS